MMWSRYDATILPLAASTGFLGGVGASMMISAFTVARRWFVACGVALLLASLSSKSIADAFGISNVIVVVVVIVTLGVACFICAFVHTMLNRRRENLAAMA